VEIFATLSASVAEPFVQFLRVLRAVKDGVYDETSRCRFVEDFKRETADERPPKILQGGREHERMSQGHEKTSLYTTQEVLTKPRFAFLISVVGCRNIVRSLRGEDDFFNHGGRVPAV